MKHILISLVSIFMTFSNALCLEQTTPWQEVLKELGIRSFEGSEVLGVAESPYDQVEIAGVNAKGRLLRILYYIPSALSALEITDNYIEDLKQSGFEVVSQGPGSTYNILVRCDRYVKACDIPFPIGDGNNTRQLTVQKSLGANQFAYFKIELKTAEKGKPFKISNADGSVKKEITAGSYVLLADLVVPKALSKRMVENKTNIVAMLNEKGRVNIYGIYFDFDKDNIKEESTPVLDSIAALVKEDTSLKLKIVGHTDNVGTDMYNDDLSSRRAKAVVLKLTEKYGIESGRLSPEGKGAKEPVASNDTEDGRAKNRRVELIKL